MKNHNFFNIDFDAHYHPAKSQIKIELAHGETKLTNCI
jgi:hypothetical protein